MTTNADILAEAWRHQQAGDPARAEAMYRAVLQQEPRYARAWYVLGTACEAQGRLAEAVGAYRRALEIRPDEAGGHFHLANALLAQRQWETAEAAYRRCLELQPDHLGAVTNLGVALSEQGNLEYATACYRRALALQPDCVEAHHNLANLLRRQNQIDEAIAHYRAALRTRPNYTRAHFNLGATLASQGRADEAIPHLQEALRLQPDQADVLNTLGAAISTQGRLDEAIAHYEKAVGLRPDFAEAHWNLALALLLRGDYERGWAEYEWRWQWREHVPSFTQPRWDGAPLAGRTILLFSEQGLGDTLQFIRFAPLVKARGGTVLVQCQRPLVRLLSGCPGIDRVVAAGDPLPDFAVQAPLMSVAGLLGITLATVPARIPYLFAAPELVEHWRRQLAPVRGLRVGIAWQGSSTHPWDQHRSIPAHYFEALARVEGMSLISLQKGVGAETLAGPGARSLVWSPGSHFDEQAGPFMDTAAIMQHLDLVIAADTAVAHLAGALGVPAWVGLCSAPDWRWGLHGEDSPWYPTLRLFRQTASGDWQGVFARIAAALRQRVVARTMAAPLLIEVSPGELLDRIARLETESERNADAVQLARVRGELAALVAVRARALPSSDELDGLSAELRAVHAALARAHTDLRQCEREQDFGSRFVELARALASFEVRRGAFVCRINEPTRAHLSEVTDRTSDSERSG